jgi:hypothetical protein
VLCTPRAKARTRPSTASRLTPGDLGASRAVLKVLQLPRKRRKNLPVSLTAALQFLPTRMDRRFLSPAPLSLERRSNGRSSGRTSLA